MKVKPAMVVGLLITWLSLLALLFILAWARGG
jgi:hypothetical protein